jgi:iron complex outermembrane recepter protein
MRKMIFTTWVGTILIALQSMAQGPGKISGTVTDGKKALAAVTVTLLQAKDSSLVKADATNAEGKFEIPVIKSGDYVLSYTAVGFEKKILCHLHHSRWTNCNCRNRNTYCCSS